MAFYYNHLDRGKLQDLAKTTGRAAHLARNSCQGFANLMYPQIQVVDNISGQIQGQCRALVGQIQNKIDLKNTLRNVVRPMIFLKSLINGSLPAYINEMEEGSLDQIKHFIKIMFDSIRQLDERINKAILQESSSMFQSQSSSSSESIVNKMDPNDQVKIKQHFFNKPNLQSNKFEQKPQFPDFKKANLKLSRFISNSAHKIQDFASEWMNVAPENAQTNKIINLAGQIENQARDMQVKLMNYGRVNYNKDQVINGIKGNCDKIKSLQAEIVQVTENQACPLKLNPELGDFGRVYGDIAEIRDVIRENTEKNFIPLTP